MIETNVTSPARAGEWYSVSVKRTIATETIAPATRAMLMPRRTRHSDGTSSRAREDGGTVRDDHLMGRATVASAAVRPVGRPRVDSPPHDDDQGFVRGCRAAGDRGPD